MSSFARLVSASLGLVAACGPVSVPHSSAELRPAVPPSARNQWHDAEMRDTGAVTFAIPLVGGSQPGTYGQVRIANRGSRTVDVRWSPCAANLLLYADSMRTGAPAYDATALRRARLATQGVLLGCAPTAPGARLRPGETAEPAEFRVLLPGRESLDSAGLAPARYFATIVVEGIGWTAARGQHLADPPLRRARLSAGSIVHSH